MSDQGEPIVNVEKIVTVMPDGRKVIKTRTTKTYKQTVTVPAGTPLPEGAHLVSTVQVPGTTSTTTSYTTCTSSSDDNGGNGNGNGSIQTYQVQEQEQQPSAFNQFLQQGQQRLEQKFQRPSQTAEPQVFVETTVDDNGRKVTKTTTTTTSSSSNNRNSNSHSPFSSFFRKIKEKLDGNSSDEDDRRKPLPPVPVESPSPEPEHKIQVTQTQHHYQQQPVAEAPKVHVQKIEITSEVPRVTLSDLTGEHRALLIGINYTGLANPLSGCVNDTRVMKEFLLDSGFKNENIRVLTDDQVGTEFMPTKENILRNLRWLVADAETNDSYFLHYSGHGGQVYDQSGDEINKDMDECIFPVDHETNGVIIDDELHDMLVKALPPGVRLTVVFDCCHSGSALDLPYVYASTGFIRGTSALASLGYELVQENFDADAVKELQEKYKALLLEERELKRQVRLKAANADVIMFSGCKDDQTSADVKITRGTISSANGAMTYAFTKSIRQNPNQSYQEMLNSIRDLLKEKYNQKPQLSSCRPMDMQEVFHF
ncbi:Ca(2+)-dependent cysteine protease [Actinomortierella ambigua]|uniref:Ca(2+)-dependent cysteine protease n=1 Tax=Actinomortierella ambigua TaxID=1343610 RepID=A0A9P6QJ51_9FUNG|nr:Ca(2+)-dependent cysteine protease [Actinomortierella ambigua]